MDRYGIDLQLLSYGNSSPQNLAPANAISLCQQANDELARVIATQPTRFAGLAVLPVGDPTAAATELKRAVTQLGFKGALFFAMASQLEYLSTYILLLFRRKSRSIILPTVICWKLSRGSYLQLVLVGTWIVAFKLCA